MSAPLLQLTQRDLKHVRALMEYVNVHYAKKISIEHLALEAGLNKEKLQAGIRQLTGYTMHGYLRHIRIEKSKQLLEDTDLPIKAVALRVGFRKAGHYAQVFKTAVRLSPSDYRSAHGH